MALLVAAVAALRANNLARAKTFTALAYRSFAASMAAPASPGEDQPKGPADRLPLGARLGTALGPPLGVFPNGAPRRAPCQPAGLPRSR